MSGAVRPVHPAPRKCLAAPMEANDLTFDLQRGIQFAVTPYGFRALFGAPVGPPGGVNTALADPPADRRGRPRPPQRHRILVEPARASKRLGRKVSCYLVVESDAEVDAVHARGLAAGGMRRQDPTGQDYGGR